jgi:glutamate decarboxylase
MCNLTRTADYLSAAISQMGFVVLSQGKGKGLPLVAFRLNPEHEHKFDEFAIAHQLRERGWVVPAYTMAPHSESMKLMRVVVREDFSRSRCDALIQDLHLAVQELSKMNDRKLEAHEEHMKSHGAKSGRHKGMNQQFADEKHSLSGRHGKTHAVC